MLTSDKPGDEKESPKVISIGITDGLFTAVTEESLPVGTKVVTDETDEEEKKK